MAKPGKMAPFEKILNLMVTGEPVTKEEIEKALEETETETESEAPMSEASTPAEAAKTEDASRPTIKAANSSCVDFAGLISVT